MNSLSNQALRRMMRGLIVASLPFGLSFHAFGQLGCALFPLPSVSVGSGTYTQAVGDFNGDGAADVAVARTQDKLAVLFNDGHGGFTVGPDYVVPAHPRDLAIRDIDADG